MALRRRWTLVAVPISSGFSQTLAETFNHGDREWFWTKRGAWRAGAFHSGMLPVGMLVTHESELEEALETVRSLERH